MRGIDIIEITAWIEIDNHVFGLAWVMNDAIAKGHKGLFLLPIKVRLFYKYNIEFISAIRKVKIQQSLLWGRLQNQLVDQLKGR